MQRITIAVEQHSDLQLLLQLAERIGLRLLTSPQKEMSSQIRERHLAIIQKDGDTSYIQDPVAWQRKEREDRELPPSC